MQIKFFIIEQSCLTGKDGAEWLNCGLINSYGKASPGNNWGRKAVFNPKVRYAEKLYFWLHYWYLKRA